MSASALLDCTFGAWHPRYAHLAPAAEVIPLPEDFAAFLAEDGVVVGEESDAVPRRAAPQQRAGQIIDEDDYAADFPASASDGGASDGGASDGGASDGGASDGGAAAAAPDPWAARFPALRGAIDAAIARLGGAVAPKLNWSSPSDATWVSTTNSMRCTSADQVVLLLKSSDRVIYDLELLGQIAGREGSTPAARAAPTLALRAWEEIRPEREFRCFVHNHDPVGICQRDPSQHFPQLQGAAEQARLREAICGFHHAHFGRDFVRGSYALDVHVAPNGRVRLVDINPIADTTQPLLFDWQQLPYGQPRCLNGSEAEAAALEAAALAADAEAVAAAGDSRTPPARRRGTCAWDQVPLLLVESAAAVQPGARVACGMPHDMLHMQEGMEDLIRLLQQHRHGSSSDSDDGDAAPLGAGQRP